MSEQINPRLNQEQDLLRTSLVRKRESETALTDEEIEWLAVLEKLDKGDALSNKDNETLLEIDQRASGKE